jgi:putative oxidoreductase
MKFIPLIGRILFSLIFLMSGLMGHLIGASGTAAYAASAGLPAPMALVVISGIIALLGALSIILGYKAKLGAWLIVLFLIPVTFTMHKFWTVTDPMQAQIAMSLFMKNIALIGAALMITYFGAGPVSIDASKGKE